MVVAPPSASDAGAVNNSAVHVTFVLVFLAS